MRHDNRLSRLLHVLLHMADHDEPLTSDRIAKMVGTNPVLVRRMMAGLRDAGYVWSGKGHGGGWTLERPLDEISLRDVYDALGEPEIFAFGLSTDAPKCLVEQAVNEAIEEARRDARETLLKRFGEVRLSDIAAEFKARMR